MADPTPSDKTGKQGDGSGKTDQQKSTPANAGNNPKDKASSTNTDNKEKVVVNVDEVVANYVEAERSRPLPPGANRRIQAFSSKTGKPILDEMTTQCCHGGVPSPQVTSSRKDDNCCEDCFKQFKEVGIHHIAIFKQGLDEGKKCGCSEEEVGETDKKMPLSTKILLVVFVILLTFAGIEAKRWLITDPEAKVEQTQETTPTTASTPTSVVVDPSNDYQINGEPKEDSSVADSDEKSQEVETSEKELDDALITILRDKENFRILPDKLAGENKFILMASIVCTPYEFTEEELQRRAAAIKTGEIINTNPKDIAQKARNYARFAKWSALGKNAKSEESLHWWANAYISEAPSSESTAFSKQVMKNLKVLKRILENKGTSVDKLLADV